MNTRCWIAVASAEHVGLGRAQGFMQVCHGKAAPLRRLAPGDVVAYYSPTHSFGGKNRLQAFTAIGTVREGAPYSADMGGGFVPHRRDVDWWRFQPAPIQPLLEKLSFTAGERNWGYRFRFGLLQVTAADMQHIAAAMQAQRDSVSA
jgi:EVE domain